MNDTLGGWLAGQSARSRAGEAMTPPESGWLDWVSSNVIAGNYDAATGVLWVKFGDNKSGRPRPVTHYRYEGVPPEAWEALKAADSKGEAHARIIKRGGYDYRGPF